jgi:hypothetical protein
VLLIDDDAQVATTLWFPSRGPGGRQTDRRAIERFAADPSAFGGTARPPCRERARSLVINPTIPVVIEWVRRSRSDGRLEHLDERLVRKPLRRRAGGADGAFPAGGRPADLVDGRPCRITSRVR